MERAPCRSPSANKAQFSALQGQYLAFIHAYSKVNRRPPAQADLQCHVQVTPPTVHQRLLTLERRGYLHRTPGRARALKVLVALDQLPVLR